jgi:hypothetical protein
VKSAAFAGAIAELLEAPSGLVETIAEEGDTSGELVDTSDEARGTNDEPSTEGENDAQTSQSLHGASAPTG